MPAQRRPDTLSGPIQSPLPDETPSVDLDQRLDSLARDRERSTHELVADTALEVQAWCANWPSGWSNADVGVELERGLAAWSGQQGWRGAAARFVDALRRTWHAHAHREREELAAILVEESGLWAWSVEEGLEALGEFDSAWDGAPLSPGRRLLPPRLIAEHAARTLGHGEVVLASAWSETVALALELAWNDGKRPVLLIGEGLPFLDGRRMARRLVREGVRVQLVFDAALLDALPRADRVWLSTEAVGAGAFLARRGTCRLVEEARRQRVPVSLLAGSDTLVPGGGLELPAWMREDASLLWEDAHAGVELDLAFLERAPLALVPDWITEIGEETPARLALRALSTEAERRCDHAQGVHDASAQLG